MIPEEHIWNILKDVFENEGFVSHQTKSFDNLLNYGIPKIITEEPNIVIIPKPGEKDKKYIKYTISFDNVYIPKPSIIEDREIHTFYPSEARQRDLTYDSPIFVNITETTEIEGSEPEVVKHNRVMLGRIPIMLRSNWCYLTNMTPSERIEAGECPYDEGGYFIVKGKERVLIGQIRGVYNIPLVIEQKSGDKNKFICELRSMSEETGHSVLIQAIISSDGKSLTFSIPHMKEPIPVGIVFKALGFSAHLRSIIALNGHLADKYYRMIYNDSYIVEPENEEEVYNFVKTIDNKPNWDRLSDEEKQKWWYSCTENKALRYIGIRSNNPLKDNERVSYAKHVLEYEIFPHLGITSSTIEKIYTLANMVQKLIATNIGMRNVDDRDNYINKRVESAGVLCYELFRQLFKKYINSIINQIEKKKQFPDVMSIIPRLTDITKGFQHCFGTGNWGVPKNSYVRPGVAQILSRLSYGATLSNLRRLSIPIGKESKNSAIRQINPSQIMYICPVECFDPNTDVIMWSGMIKKAKNIIVGDHLIDDLGYPVEVRKTCTGYKNMYDIIPDNATFSKHRVTDNHILTLLISGHKEATIKNNEFVIQYFDHLKLEYKIESFKTYKEYVEVLKTIRDNNTIDITIQNYLSLPTDIQKKLLLYRVKNINWSYKAVPIDPYVAGMWLGEHLERKNTVTHEEVDVWIQKNIPHLQSLFVHNYLYANNNYINNLYMNNDRVTRIKLLNGIVSTAGHVFTKNMRLEFIYYDKEKENFFKQIQVLVVSLGYSFKILSETMIIYGFVEESLGTYFEDNNTTTFSLKEVGTGPFVGWQLKEPPGRFIIGCGCVTHNTPEGAPVGTVLNLSLLTQISDRTPTVIVKEVIELCENIIHIDDLDQIEQDTKVFLNGMILGITTDPVELINEIKELRKANVLDWNVSIAYDNIDDEIQINSDEGRLLRPVFIVKGDKIEATIEDGTSWANLVKKGLITYIDNFEANGSVIAFSQNELGKYHNDYCEIAPTMMMGVMGNIIPFPDHSQCIFIDEPVYMSDGSIRKISDVKVGDKVITFDPETLEESITEVSHTYTNNTNKQLYELTTINNRKIIATYDHRFMTNQGWCRLENIKEYETLVGISTGPKPVSLFVDEYIVLSENNFIKICDKIGHDLNTNYLKDLKKFFPLKSTDKKLIILSRIIGYIFINTSIKISCDGNEFTLLCMFTDQQDAKMFKNDVETLGFKTDQYSDCVLLYKGILPILLISLHDISDNKIFIPDWIKNGSDMVKREFLAGFSGYCPTQRNSHSYIYTIKSIKVYNYKHAQKLVQYMINITEIFKYFGIKVDEPSILFDEKIKLYNILLHLDNSIPNIIQCFEHIGYRYYNKKKLDIAILVEYYRYQTYVENPLDIEEWKKIIKCTSTTIFMPIKTKIKSQKTMISDITTSSKNQSFICGDRFCVHNSPRNTYQCLHPDTLVIMSDKTKKAIKDIVIGEEIITVDPVTCEQSITKVINQYVKNTDKKILTIITESGRKITCTDDHLVLTSTGWLKASEAEDICVIPQQILYPHLETVDLCIDLPETTFKEKHCEILKNLGLLPVNTNKLPILARMIGFLFSSGSYELYSDGLFVEFYFDSKQDCKEFINDVSTLGFDNNKVTVAFELDEENNNYIKLICNNYFASLLIALTESSVFHPILPKWIQNGSLLVKREFLSGFNGGVNKQVPTLINFILDIIKLFDIFEIKTNVPIINNSAELDLVFSIENYINYFERIGFRYNTHRLYDSIFIIEYLKTCQEKLKEIQHDKNIIKNMLESNKTISDIAKTICKNYNDVNDIITEPTSLPLDFNKWNRITKNNAIFVHIKSKINTEGNIIADITTESKNQSFIAGDSLCVHNSAMGKQAMSMFALSHLIRADTVVHVLNTPQRPLVSTRGASIMGFDDMPSGINAVVAIACYTGLTVC